MGQSSATIREDTAALIALILVFGSPILAFLNLLNSTTALMIIFAVGALFIRGWWISRRQRKEGRKNG